MSRWATGWLAPVVAALLLAGPSRAARGGRRRTPRHPATHALRVRPAERAARQVRMGVAVAHGRLRDERRGEPPELRDGRDPLAQAEAQATAAGRRVLSTARAMLSRGAVVVGSCWDYVNAVYNRAGYTSRRGGRRAVFAGSRERGRFADVRLIQPGDWLYYVNHSYSGSPHSAIFVGWRDRRRKRALMVSYRGQRRAVPGRLAEYDLSSVYRIIRPAR